MLKPANSTSADAEPPMSSQNSIAHGTRRERTLRSISRKSLHNTRGANRSALIGRLKRDAVDLIYMLGSWLSKKFSIDQPRSTGISLLRMAGAKAQYASWLKHSMSSAALKWPVLRMYADSEI